MKSVDLMSLWGFVCSVLLCSLWEKEHWRLVMGSSFSHRTHRSNRAFLRTVSSPQNASGIQSSQSITAKEGCWVIVVRCWWLAIGVSRWLRPSLWGRGRGRGLFFSACSPCSQKGLCSSVKICEKYNSQRNSCILFSQNYTDEQILQRCTETLSQPITQNVSANDGCKFCDICRLLADVCEFPLWAERLLFICENLWEI